MPRRRAELLDRQLIGACGWPIDHSRQAIAVLQDRAILRGTDFLGCEAGEMDDAPEPIAAPGKMVPGGGGGHSRVDAAEDHRKLSGQDIRKCNTHDPLYENRSRWADG